MKRISAACVTQMLHFQPNEHLGHEHALKEVKEEVKRYKGKLERSGIPYKILSETVQEDGSVKIEIKKQYQTFPVVHYLD